MKLIDLEPRWIGINGWDAADGTQYYTVGGLYKRGPGGVSFQCPTHSRRCGECGQWIPGSHRLAVWFANPADGLPPERSAEHKWTRDGESFETLTLSPSVNAQMSDPNCWHGFIINGEIR